MHKELVIVSKQNLENCLGTENNEENDSSTDGEDENRLCFVRFILGNTPILNNEISGA